MLLSALDFPFCFAAVRYLGTDRIGHYEHVVVEWVKSVIPEPVREAWRARMVSEQQEVEGGGRAATVVPAVGGETAVEGYAVVKGDGEVGVAGYDHGVKEAEKRNESENASEFAPAGYVWRCGLMSWGLGIWTQLALAYAIHKSFIFIRVPLTVAVTPKVVKVLRGWGWDIGKRRPKGVK